MEATEIHGLAREANTIGRDVAAAALSRHLELGRKYTDPDASFAADELLSWSQRCSGLARTLADCVEAPLRNEILASLDSPLIPDDTNALHVLRLNMCGESHREFGAACGLTRMTIATLEEGGVCQVSSAAAVADRFGLTTLDLFYSETNTSRMRVRSVAGLREALKSSDRTIHSDRAPANA